MTDLQVRRVRFDFAGDDIPFSWHPTRPAFAAQCNLISFVAPGFEKFIVEATRQAIPLIRDGEVAAEAEAYLRQEAQHSAAHAAHARALARRWTGLRQTLTAVTASYDRLTATKPLAWRLAYIAIIEATFTPYFTVFLENEDTLFAPGDERVASLFLWHFVEEIEHRSSALKVYDAVHDSYPYRVKTIAGVVRHFDEILRIVVPGFRAAVPDADGGDLAALLPEGLSWRALRTAQRTARGLPAPQQPTYAGVPRRELLDMIVGLVRSQAPNHDPATERVPPFAGRWFERFDTEPRSAARWYTVGVEDRT
ncbi:metal-dependent hydrolase [Mycolicibacterium vaccae]|uniref:metal-dependent hydrolase n=1 Tax=Mycolicibacterium vaccae TaxID=1810 RepID=UPI003CFC1592